MRIPLIGGAYATRSPIASSMRCVNLYPEKNREDSSAPWTYYQRPGRRLLSSPPASGVGRGLYCASNGKVLFAVVGQNVYSISATWAWTLVGQVAIAGTVPAIMADNGTTVVLVDGSTYGYTFSLAGVGFARIADATGIFLGATGVDYLDTFLLWNLPGTIQFGSTYSNEVVFDPTWTAGKTGYPDPLVRVFVNRHEILLLGLKKSEIWYDAGNALFPFAILPGADIEWGCIAPYSVASFDVSVFWLAQSLSGTGLVVRQKGYETRVVSNYALSYAIGQMIKAGHIISDAVGYTFTRDGHAFYVLSFPSADQTWVYDDSIDNPAEAWHQEGYTDANGVLHRDRVMSQAFFNNTNVGMDWENGSIYALDPDYYADQVDDGDGQGNFARPISYIRTFPKLGMGRKAGMPAYYDSIPANGLTMKINRFILEMECGNGPQMPDGSPAKVGLRYSEDHGKTFGNTVMQSAGLPGFYSTAPDWTPIGISRWPVLEVSHSIAGPAAISGAWVNIEALET